MVQVRESDGTSPTVQKGIEVEIKCLFWNYKAIENVELLTVVCAKVIVF
jgi:hypothetical protein